MKAEKLKKISKELHTAIKACQKNNIPIAPRYWGTRFSGDNEGFVAERDGDEIGSVCAMGALLVHKDGSIDFDEYRGKKGITQVEEPCVAAYVLGVDECWVYNFTRGFDGDEKINKSDWFGPGYAAYSEAFDMGKRFRKKYAQE